MAVTPHLSRQLRQALGEEAAEDLVTWMHDTEAERSASRNAVRADIAQLRQETQAGFAAIREEMAHLETRIERRFGDLLKWSFVFWVGAVSAIAMLAGVLP